MKTVLFLLAVFFPTMTLQGAPVDVRMDAKTKARSDNPSVSIRLSNREDKEVKISLDVMFLSSSGPDKKVPAHVIKGNFQPITLKPREEKTIEVPFNAGIWIKNPKYFLHQHAGWVVRAVDWESHAEIEAVASNQPYTRFKEECPIKLPY